MKIYRKPAKIKVKQKNSSPFGIFPTIQENFDFLEKVLGTGSGLIMGKHTILQGKLEVGVAYIEGLTNVKLLSNQVIEPLQNGCLDFPYQAANLPGIIGARYISVTNNKQGTQINQVIESLFEGNPVLFWEDAQVVLMLGLRQVENRAIEKPDNEVTVHASMDSFTEDLETNRSLVIRRLPTPNLHFKSFTVGKLSRTKVILFWLDGIANPKAITEAQERIEQIDIDMVDGIGVLAELIEDSPITVFPKYLQTQRPDLAAKYLSDGRFAILCSNSPWALVAPISFWDNFITMDDYAESPVVSSFLRIVRYISLLISIIVSPLYLSFVTFNHSIVPPALALNIAMGRAGVPFPSVVELLIMTISFDIIREASLRIPGSVGFFVGSIAAVVIGQSTVSAGYVSASLIIVIAISGISSFAISNTSLIYPARLISYFFILLAGTFGTFGLINGVVLVFWHLLSLESFQLPYFYPLVPFDLEGMKDTFIRAPYRYLNKRLRIHAPYNRVRMNNK